MRLGFIGTGTIVSAVVQGIAQDGHQIVVSARNTAHSTRLAARYDNVTVAGNQGVIDASEIVFLGLVAAAAPDALRAVRFRSDQRVISFMAGMALDTLADLVAPACPSAIMLPFPGIARGGSPVLALGDTEVIKTLFTPANTLFALRDAEELDAYLCAQAVLSPATQLVATTADWLARRGTDPGQGEAFLRLLVGSNLMTSDCRSLLDALNTIGGYNQRLRHHMEGADMPAQLLTGLDDLSGNT